MKWLEVAVTTTAEAVEAVAAHLERLGGGGAVIEDPSLVERRKLESPWDLFTGDLAPAEAHRVIAYWPAGPETDARLADLRRFLDDLPSFGLDPGAGAVSVRQRDEAEWAEAWKRFYHTQRVGRVIIRPSWEEYRPAPGEILLDLDPGMAFGTGTHPSTALCLELLQELISGGESVVDAGTGSGILTLAALKLGAGRALACDVDPVACQVAKENFRRNGMEGRVSVVCGDVREALAEVGEPPDLILANIVAEVIISLSAAFAAGLVPGGRLIASGIVVERQPEVAAALASAGFRLQTTRERDGWVALVGVREG